MVKINKIFWKNKKVLITGHTGFKGGWLSAILHDLGSILYGYALPPRSKNGIFKSSKINNFFKISKYDNICNYNSLKKFIYFVKPDIIFHLAAQPIVLDSYKDPINTFNTNIIGTANLCDIVVNYKKTNSLIIATSDKCYLNYDKKIKFFKETDSLGGFDPYSASKAGTEIIVQSFQKSFFKKLRINAATVRAGNVIGGGDDSRHRICPDIIKTLQNKKQLIIRNPNAIRPWQHVLEPLSGYIKLAENLYLNKREFIGSWNFGPKKNSIKKVIDLVSEVKKVKTLNVSILNSKVKQYESQYLGLNIKKSQKFLKWVPKLSFSENIKLVLDWHDSKNKRFITINQIKSYFKWKN